MTADRIPLRHIHLEAPAMTDLPAELTARPDQPGHDDQCTPPLCAACGCHCHATELSTSARLTQAQQEIADPTATLDGLAAALHQAQSARIDADGDLWHPQPGGGWATHPDELEPITTEYLERWYGPTRPVLLVDLGQDPELDADTYDPAYPLSACQPGDPTDYRESVASLSPESARSALAAMYAVRDRQAAELVEVTADRDRLEQLHREEVASHGRTLGQLAAAGPVLTAVGGWRHGEPGHATTAALTAAYDRWAETARRIALTAQPAEPTPAPADQETGQ